MSVILLGICPWHVHDQLLQRTSQSGDGKTPQEASHY